MDAGDIKLLENGKAHIPQYIVITPVRDEAVFIEKTLYSMVNQTIKPIVWIIVNDGSSDDTEEIVERWATSYPWIRLINRQDRGSRQRGRGVIEAFYDGYSTVTDPFDYIVKLDGDVSFQENYFEGLLQEFSVDSELGIAGGGVYERPNGEVWLLYTYRDSVRGATKIYRKACFDAIGGLVPAMGWDGVDEWSALSLGWKVQSFIEFKLYHYRFTGTASGFMNNYFEQGQAAYLIGYHPLYIIARGIRRFSNRPYIIGGLGMIAAYFYAWIHGDKQFPNSTVVHYVRHTQLKRLVSLAFGKHVHIS